MSTIQAMSQSLQGYEEFVKRIEQQQSQQDRTPLSEGAISHHDPSVRTTTTAHSVAPAEGIASELSTGMPPDLSLDANGRPCYHGPTSSIYDPTRTLTQYQFHNPSSDRESRRQLADFAAESRSWEGYALDSASLRTNIPRPVISELLQLHWSWIAPMFMWVYRPAFTRQYPSFARHSDAEQDQVIWVLARSTAQNFSSLSYVPTRHGSDSTRQASL